MWCLYENKVKGAPLTVTKKHLINKKAQAIIINSGNANTCNGEMVYQKQIQWHNFVLKH